MQIHVCPNDKSTFLRIKVLFPDSEFAKNKSITSMKAARLCAFVTIEQSRDELGMG